MLHYTRLLISIATLLICAMPNHFLAASPLDFYYEDSDEEDGDEQAARAQSRSSVEDLLKRQWRFNKRNRGESAELYYNGARSSDPLTEENLLRSDGGVLQIVEHEIEGEDEALTTNPQYEIPITSYCNRGTFSFFGDYLYLQTREEGLGFGYETRSGVINARNSLLGIGQTGKEKTVKPGYSSGFSVGLGYLIPRNEWKLQAQWMRYQNSKKSALPTIDPVIGELPQVPSLGVIIIEDLLDKSGTLFAVEQAAKAHWNLHYNVVDLELGRTLCPSDCFSFTPLIGVRGGWISQSFKVQYLLPAYYIGPEPFNLFAPAILMKAGWDFSGYGLRAGFDLNWILGSQFFIYSNFSASFLYSQLKVSHKEKLNSGFLRTNLREVVNSITPVFELSLGLAWERSFCCDRFFVNIHAGWEEILWLDVNQTQRFNALIAATVSTSSGSHTRRDRGNLGLSGLQVGLTFGF
ncbi:MAG TPA: Lpg1974 family pore-forming outer membrane protein [Rhabdochlamydiaceae bacterium]|nr:Lpg1974 family pore-forming outer membrane protein [Rhabdochlamydiaceae bacterium]